MRRRPTLNQSRLGALLCAVLLAILALFDTAAAARGLLAAWIVALSAPTGSMVLLLVHRLTGGAWGETGGTPLRVATAALVPVSLCGLPILLALPLVYPWAADPQTIGHADVAALYLNAPAFVLRAIVALTLWCVLAVFARREARPGLVGLGLFAYGLTISVVSVDWVLSLDPHFGSSAFAMSMGLSHLLAGAAYAGLLVSDDRKGAGDLTKLVVTFAIGLVYLDLMQFLVIYDGNLPERTAWYVRRSAAGWFVLLGFALLFGAVVPTVSLMRETWRRSPDVRRAACLAAVVGLTVRLLWWVLPEWGVSPLVWLATVLSTLTIVGIVLGFPNRARIGFREVRHGA